MATAETKLMTADEFYEFVHRPENRDRVFELERGEIVEMTKPGKFHGFVCANIAAILGIFARARKKGYVCTNNTGVVVERDPDTVLGPDILFFEDAESPGEIERNFATTPPLLAIEVLSPNDSHGKHMRRIKQYLRRGVPLVWCLDPEDRVVTVYRPGKEHDVIDCDGEITGEDVLPDCRFRVAELFTLPGEQSSSESTNS